MTENILQEADRITAGDRRKAYGSAVVDFTRIAGMWSSLLGNKLNAPIEPHEYALMMVCVKISRYLHGQGRDSLVDIAGYARTVEMLADDDDKTLREEQYAFKKPVTPEAVPEPSEPRSEADLTEHEREQIYNAVVDRMGGSGRGRGRFMGMKRFINEETAKKLGGEAPVVAKSVRRDETQDRLNDLQKLNAPAGPTGAVAAVNQGEFPANTVSLREVSVKGEPEVHLASETNKVVVDPKTHIKAENYDAIETRSCVTHIQNVSTDFIKPTPAFDSGVYQRAYQALAASQEHLAMTCAAPGIEASEHRERQLEGHKAARELAGIEYPDTPVVIAGQKITIPSRMKQYSNDISQAVYVEIVNKLIGHARVKKIYELAKRGNQQSTPALWLNQQVFIAAVRAGNSSDKLKCLEHEVSADISAQADDLLKQVLGKDCFDAVENVRTTNFSEISNYAKFVGLIDRILEEHAQRDLRPTKPESIWDKTPVRKVLNPEIPGFSDPVLLTEKQAHDLQGQVEEKIDEIMTSDKMASNNTVFEKAYFEKQFQKKERFTETGFDPKE